jgi:hypothetical protein
MTYLKGLFDNASKIRDLTLVAVTATYVPGFLSWSIYAWYSGLGFAPALDAQYIMAGIIPLAILAISGALVFLQVQLAQGIKRLQEAEIAKIKSHRNEQNPDNLGATLSLTRVTFQTVFLVNLLVSSMVGAFFLGLVYLDFFGLEDLGAIE